jgi:hypothetical protein
LQIGGSCFAVVGMEDNNVAVFLLKNLGKTWAQTECSPISDLFPPAVDDFETVRASEFNQVQQLLGRSPRQLQKQPLENRKFLQLSGTPKNLVRGQGMDVGSHSQNRIVSKRYTGLQIVNCRTTAESLIARQYRRGSEACR